MEKSRFAQFDQLLNSAMKSVQRLKGVYMDKYSLSAAHTDCLCRMQEHPEGLTQHELVTLEAMDKAQVSRVLNTLTERGLVMSDTPGSYKKRYRLTEAGQSVAAEIQQTILNINRFVSDEIGGDEISAFYATFERIADKLKSAVDLSSETDSPFRKE